eukprot:2981646-Pleurochrysis_carterae.AAC.1
MDWSQLQIASGCGLRILESDGWAQARHSTMLCTLDVGHGTSPSKQCCASTSSMLGCGCGA